MNLKKYGGNMKIKNKLVFNTFVYALISLILFSVLILLNIIGTIKANDYIVNICVYIFSSVICIGYYIFIYKNYLNNNRPKDCIVMMLITLVLGIPQIILGLKIPGIHLAVISTWYGGLLSLSINNIILCLKKKNSAQKSNDSVLSLFISLLKIWISVVFPAMFIFGLAIVFFAEHFAVL